MKTRILGTDLTDEDIRALDKALNGMEMSQVFGGSPMTQK